MTNHQKTLMSSILLSVCFTANVYASINGYVGNQSFELSDDVQMQKYSKNMKNISVLKNEHQKKFDAQNRLVTKTKNELRSIKKQIDTKEASLKASEKKLSSLQAKLKAEEAKLAEAATEEDKALIQKNINSAKKQIASANNSVATATGAIKTLKANGNKKNEALKAQNNQLSALRNKVTETEARLVEVKRTRDRYQNELVSKILNANKRGALEGNEDGREDGKSLARKIGKREGREDGNEDGRDEGISDGQRREYTAGYDEGQIIGNNKGQSEGEFDGTILGTSQGNSIAGDEIGSEDGVEAAQNSNANKLGTESGNTDGMERAVNTGNRVGTSQGESQAIDQHENADLNEAEVLGAFAGAFEKSVPGYPGPSNNNYNTYGANAFNNKLVRRAYKDGYDRRYNVGSRQTFERNVDDFYEVAYDNNFEDAYNDYLNKFYEQAFASGKQSGEEDGFNSAYPIAKDAYTKIFKEQFSSSPNKNSSEYKESYSSAKESAYNNMFNLIYNAAYSESEEKTFAANIAEQTEKYRKLRFDSVDNTYKTNSVLAFEASTITDGGINGVAKFDGVFQPEEQTLHNVIITNYGDTPASNVVVKLSSGQDVKLPSIAGKSTVTIKGAAQGVVTSPEGYTDRISMTVIAEPSGEKSITGRHFDSLYQNVLVANESKSNRVQYPLTLSSLGTTKQLLKDVSTPLSVTLNNNSNRSYSGGLDIVVDSSVDGILAQNFQSVSKLDNSLKISDASLLVTDANDIYTPIRFNAKVYKNGVLLGKLSQGYQTMAKSKFINRPGTPVLVANSDVSSSGILSVIDQLDGVENVSILDTSLKSLNASALRNPLNKRVALIIEDGTGASSESVEPIVKVSKNLVLLSLNDKKTVLPLISNSSNFRDSFTKSFKVKGMRERTISVSNMHRVTSLKGETIALESRESDFSSEYYLAQQLTLSADELLAKISSEVSYGDYYNPSFEQGVLISALQLKSLFEIGTINIAYDKSKKGFFSKRDKKYYKMIENGSNLFIHRMKNFVNKAAASSRNLTAILASFHNYYVVENAVKLFRPISKDIKLKIETKSVGVVKDMKKVAVKKLKAISKDAYTKAYRNEHVYTPFEPGKDYSNGRH